MTFEERLDAMELEIRKPIFRKNRGRANEVNYWVFDYPPEKELEVRAVFPQDETSLFFSFHALQFLSFPNS